MVKKTSTAVATQQEQHNSIEEVPDYLKDQRATGLEGLGKGDYKIPRIKLLQPLNPEIQSFPGVAIPGDFWHTGANIPLGTEFEFVPCIGSKRVILWNPRENGGGMLAFSRDGKSWNSGGNQKHVVKIKGRKDPVIYDTGKDVHSSGLTLWGTQNPDDPESGPAATVHYEYMCYLPNAPELSPVVLGLTRTAAVNAKTFNTLMLMKRKPIQSMKFRCFSDTKSDAGNTWSVPNFAPLGYVSEEIYHIAKNIEDQQKDYTAEYDQSEAQPTTALDDSIPF